MLDWLESVLRLASDLNSLVLLPAEREGDREWRLRVEESENCTVYGVTSSGYQQ